MTAATRWAGRDAPTHPAVSAGQTGGFIMAACGLYTFVTLLLPHHPHFHPTGVLLIGVVAVLGGIVVWYAPWDRLPDWSRLALAPASTLLITAHNVFSGLDPFKYGMFYFMVFLWLGLCERRWWSVKMAPMVAVCYLTPLLVSGASTTAILSVSYAVPLYVTVGEVLAWRTEVLRALRAELQQLADHDALTGLANRHVFNRELRAACDPGQESALIFIDLDGFKRVNDVHGHQAGDDVLVAVARTLRESVRVNRGDLAFRLAGDEFVVLLRCPDAAAAAGRVAGRLIDRLAAVHDPDGRAIRASVGIAGGPGMEPDGLVKAADEAMYRAKRTGGGLITAA